jgi:nucleotide-binding universal stress UspA family protein
MVVETRTGIDLIMEEAQQNVERVAQAAQAAGVQCTTATALSYYPAGEILAAVQRYHCDLIFMGSHGRRGLSRLLAGSETQKVLADATVPVMVLRPPGNGNKASPSAPASGDAAAGA